MIMRDVIFVAIAGITIMSLMSVPIDARALSGFTSTPARDFCNVYPDGTYHPYALGVAAGRSLPSLRSTLVGNLDRDIESYKCDPNLVMTLFDEENFQGDSIEVEGEFVTLFDWNNRARSLKVVDKRGEPAADIVGRGCSVFRPCPDGYSCQPGVHKCYPKLRQEGQPCSLGFGCDGGLVCEAGVQICKRPARVNEPCHATRPCEEGLQCEGVQQVCREYGGLDDPCHRTRRCGEGFCCDRSLQGRLDFFETFPASGLCRPGITTSGYC